MFRFLLNRVKIRRSNKEDYEEKAMRRKQYQISNTCKTKNLVTVPFCEYNYEAILGRNVNNQIIASIKINDHIIFIHMAAYIIFETKINNNAAHMNSEENTNEHYNNVHLRMHIDKQ